MPILQGTSIYYRAPEGQDITGKLSYAAKVSAITGFSLGLFDAQLFTKSKGYRGTLGRMIYWTAPAFAVSSGFVAATYIATNIRQKDDPWNYAIGGATSGAIIGALSKSVSMGFFFIGVLGAAAVVKKNVVDKNLEFFVDIPTQHQSVSSKNWDFSMRKEIPGNWVSTKSS